MKGKEDRWRQGCQCDLRVQRNNRSVRMHSHHLSSLSLVFVAIRPDTVPAMQATKPTTSSRSHRKFVTRTASILLRAKALILSDSDSDDLQSSESSGRPCKAVRKKVKHSRRSKGSSDHCLSLSFDHSHPVCGPLYGKRKRCSTMTFTTSGEQSVPCKSLSHTKSAESQKMDLSCSPCNKSCFADCMELDQDETSSLSDTSIECNSQNYDEADDEQSDFNEVLEKSKDLPTASTSRPPAQRSISHQSHQSTSKIRSAPVLRNPFATITASSSDRIERTSSIGSSSLWKKRRRSLLPEKCVNNVSF